MFSQKNVKKVSDALFIWKFIFKIPLYENAIEDKGLFTFEDVKENSDKVCPVKQKVA